MKISLDATVTRAQKKNFRIIIYNLWWILKKLS